MKSFIEFLEGYINPIFKNDKLIDKFDDSVKKGKQSDLIDLLLDINDNYKDVYKKIEDKIVSIVKPYIYKNKKNKLLTSIKSFESIVDKTVKRKKPLSQLNDIVRAAILFDNKEDVEDFVKNFRRKEENIIVGYEEKEKGNDPVYGYFGSHHFDLNISGLIVELQVMTRKMWNYKEEAHKIYVKNRSKGNPDKFDSNLSKNIFRLANESLEIEWKEIDIFHS